MRSAPNDLDGRLHLADRRADIRFLAFPLDVGRRPEGETAFREQPDPEAVVRRLERKRVGAAGNVDIPERAEFHLVRSDEFGLELSSEPDPDANVPIVLCSGRTGKGEGGSAGQQQCFHERPNCFGLGLVAEAQLNLLPLDQLGDDPVGGFLGRHGHGVDDDLGVVGHFVRAVDAGEVLDLAGSCLGV